MAESISVDPLQRFRLILDTPEMRELSVAEQRYQAVTAVIGDRLSISQAAEKVGVSRQTLHAWLARYEAIESCYHRDTFTLRAQRSPPTQGRKMEPKSAGWIADS
jgi:hypothetical protein